jgi:hypothetical protein
MFLVLALASDAEAHGRGRVQFVNGCPSQSLGYYYSTYDYLPPRRVERVFIRDPFFDPFLRIEVDRRPRVIRFVH